MKKFSNPFVVSLKLSTLVKLIAAIAAAAVIIVIIILAVSGIDDRGDNVSVSSRTVDFGLKNIGELVTQSGYYTNVQVLEDAKQILGHDVPLTKSKSIFSYDGVIKAGLDFSLIEIIVDEEAKKISVKLPEVTITSNEIDQNSLEIYDEKQSIFTRLSISDINMSQIELKNEAELKAVEQGIMDNARTNAELLITGFLSGQYDPEVYEFIFE